ncbi:hypothetical protein PT974_03636 [Cladobotryum mycophilum]|uniref:Uncharacterized protein n=1 Tax=Cladobotryum mycophilum TaxID=491253 RepID=A0ABR0ST04_9HYPO
METNSRAPSLANFRYTPVVKTTHPAVKYESVETHVNRIGAPPLRHPFSNSQTTTTTTTTATTAAQYATQPPVQQQHQTHVKTEAELPPAIPNRHLTSSRKIPASTAPLSSKTKSHRKASKASKSGSGNSSSSKTSGSKLSQEVEKLERREAQAQKRKKELKEENEKLAEKIRLLEEQSKRERKQHRDLELKQKNLQTVYDATVRDLEEQKSAFEALRLKNEDIEAELANIKNENYCLAEQLDEKTHESYVYRCAVAVAFKLLGSLRDKTTLRELLRRIVNHLRENQGRARTNHNDGNDNNDDEPTLPQAEEQSSPKSPVSDSEADPDSPILTSSRRSTPFAKRCWDAEDGESYDSEDDKPLMQIRRPKRLRPLPPMSSQETELSDDEMPF